MIRPAELIERKRDGGQLTPEEITELVLGHTRGEIPDYQLSAFCMAVYFKGLTPEETLALTDAFVRSGSTLDLRTELGRSVVDKHSTGGVGDKTSIVVGPLVSACGVPFGKMSGRGLGHTGGTLDNLDSIPGYDSVPELDRLRATVAEAGCAIVGQTADLAPADRRLYALRDATGTVESIPLIVASILSKKLAEGLDGLVMDIKAGSGAFMPTREASAELGRAIAEVSEGAGLPCTALLTDMDQVLGRTAGNALEVRESLDVLRDGTGEPRLVEVTLALARAALELAGLDADPQEALTSGAAAERFERMVDALGGTLGDLPEAPVRREVTASGVVQAIDVRALGLVVMELGGGRRRETDDIDHAVGLADVAGLGEDAGRLATVHARDEPSAARAEDAVRAAFTTGDGPVEPPPLVERIGSPDG